MAVNPPVLVKESAPLLNLPDSFVDYALNNGFVLAVEPIYSINLNDRSGLVELY